MPGSGRSGTVLPDPGFGNPIPGRPRELPDFRRPLNNGGPNVENLLNFGCPTGKIWGCASEKENKSGGCHIFQNARQECSRKSVFPAKAGIQRQSMNKEPCVYILASRRNGTLYTGVTSSLIKRVWEHKNDLVEGFTKRYGVHILVWYELHSNMESAITREKAIKEWKRRWKLELIEGINPDWRDLYDELI